ncbi:MAG: amino acid adenylation domain-containing protein, partial [Pseudomonadota bacterium]
MNTLALRLCPEPEQTANDFLQHVRDTALAAYDHQDLPFERLVEILRPERSLSHAPLFQVMFVWQSRAADELKLPSVNVEPFDIKHNTAKFDLTLLIEESPDGLSGYFEYSTDLFEAPRIQRMAGHFLTLLNGLTTDPEQKLACLPLLTDAENQQWQSPWQGVSHKYPEDNIIALFEAQVAQTPDALAVRFEGKTLSYNELNQQANQLAHYLREQGLQPGQQVAICLPRSVELVIALLGILKSGAAFVPIDPQYAPAARIRQTLIDAEVKYLIGELDETPCPLISLSGLQNYATDNPLPIAALTNPAYMVYTSGSTGQPKGVIVSHRALLNYLHGITPLLNLQGAHHFAFVSTFAADLGHTMIFPALTSGGCLHILSYERLTNPMEMSAYFTQYTIDYLKISPSHLAALHTPETEQHILPQRLLIIGGEAASLSWLRHVKSFAPCQILNHYGPSESTVGVLTWPINEVPNEGVPIGRPLPNVRAYILDKSLQPCPVGIAGELCIGGDSLADGYHNQPTLTAECFIDDPFIPHQRLYRTGDRACWLPDGAIQYLGRIDYQTKIRGFRVELEEVEQALNKQPEISQAAVALHETTHGETTLRAWLVLHDATADITELRKMLGQVLPDYMLPSSFMRVGTLPLNPNGKVDRKALAGLQGELQFEGHSGESPVTGTEIKLAALWYDLLDFEDTHRNVIHRNDDFFALGGHSLLAMQLLYRLQATFNIELSLRTLFENPSLRILATHIDSAKALAQPPLQAGSRPENLPLSFAQLRLWFLDQLEPGSAVYNIPVAWRIHGELDVDQLITALNTIAERHEILRSHFQAVDGVPAQYIEIAIPLMLPIKDLQNIPLASRAGMLETRLLELAAKPFNLATGPLCNAEVIRLHADEHVLFFMAHHTIFDGRSFEILQQELSMLLTGQALPTLGLQYADYAIWQRNLSYASQLAYWRDILKGDLPILEMPLDMPRPPIQKLRGAVETDYVSPELIEDLTELSRQHQATLFMTLLTVFAVLLNRYTGQTDLCIGTPIENRNHADIEPLIGLFVNTLVIRADLTGAPSFNELLDRVRERCLGAYNHQDLPFEQLVEALQPNRDMSRTPIFQALFAFQQEAFRQDFKAGDLHFSPMQLDSGVARTDLSFWLNLRNDGLEINLEYDRDLFTANTARRLLTHYKTLLESVIAGSDLLVTTLDFLTVVEREYLTSVWNETRLEYPHEACLHDLVASQAALVPHKIAVQFENETLSYQALEKCANQLAHYLITQGVKPGHLVGICVNRSARMMVGLLG